MHSTIRSHAIDRDEAARLCRETRWVFYPPYRVLIRQSWQLHISRKSHPGPLESMRIISGSGEFSARERRENMRSSPHFEEQPAIFTLQTELGWKSSICDSTSTFAIYFYSSALSVVLHYIQAGWAQAQIYQVDNRVGLLRVIWGLVPGSLRAIGM